MGKRIRGLLLLCLAAAFAAPLSAAEAPRETGKCMLWRVRSEGATVYLLGTIHFLKKDMYPLDGAIEKAFDESQVLVMELSLSMERQMQAGMLTMQKGMYPGGETLEGNVSKETFEKLSAFTSEEGLPAAAFARMRPWLVSMMLAVQEYAKFGLDPNLGIDKHFYDKAAARKMPVWELETVEYQLNVFSDGTAEEQELELSETLDQLPKAGEFLEKMTAAWTAGDPEALDAAMKESMTTNEKLKPREERLLYDRNLHMYDKISMLLDQEKTCFVMVGTGHLVGERSIVSMLREKGRTVEQVDKAPVEAKEAPVEAPAPPAEDEVPAAAE